MDLRSRTYNHLRDLLKCAGVYEEDMEIEEMRQLAQAIEISSNGFMHNLDMERALWESEQDFQMLANSTMIGQTLVRPPSIGISIAGDRLDRDCDSPPGPPSQLQVEALVHHELNWSPSRTSQSSKREGNQTECQVDTKLLLQLIENRSPGDTDADADENVTPISLASADPGMSCDEMSTMSSIGESSILASIGEMANLHLISTSSAAVSDFSDVDNIEYMDTSN